MSRQLKNSQKDAVMIENILNNKFWITGNGKSFLEWAKVSENEIEPFDMQLFYQYDSEFEELVKDWMGNGDFKNIMKSLHTDATADKLPDDYILFKNNLSQLPQWLDLDLIDEASKLSQRSGLIGLLVLRNFALLGGYNFANLTKPLVVTGSLEKGAVHRLYNTLNFWIEVSRTSKQSQKMRLNACMRTRLIHSASRLLIQKKHPNWDFEKYGEPINHADMIATQTAFTVYFLYGLERLNFKFSTQEEAGIFHLWKYVTWLLGVPEKIIPNNRKEAVKFFYFWTKYQGHPDEDALKLTDSLLNENTEISLLKLDLVRRNMGFIHKSVANYLIDDNIRKNLKIPSVKFQNIVPNVLRFKNGITFDHHKQTIVGNAEQLSVMKDYKDHIA